MSSLTRTSNVACRYCPGLPASISTACDRTKPVWPLMIKTVFKHVVECGPQPTDESSSIWGLVARSLFSLLGHLPILRPACRPAHPSPCSHGRSILYSDHRGFQQLLFHVEVEKSLLEGGQAGACTPLGLHIGDQRLASFRPQASLGLGS